MSADPLVPWQTLLEAFLGRLNAGPVDVGSLWRMMIADRWYRQELHRAVTWLVRQRRLPSDKADDLEHDAMLVLRRRLARRPDLGLDRARAADHFGAWLRRVIRRHCLDALRSGRPRFRPVELLPPECLNAGRGPDRWRTELRDAIDSLPGRQRAVLNAYCATGGLAEAAVSLGLSYQQARRSFLTGIEGLRLSYEPPVPRNYKNLFSQR